MSSVPSQYKDLLREVLLSDTTKRVENDRPLKRRHRKNGTHSPEPIESSLIVSPSSITPTRATDTVSMPQESDGIELASDIDSDVGDKTDQITMTNDKGKSVKNIIRKHQYENLKSDSEESEQGSDEDFDSDEFEDVDLNDIPDYEVSSNKEEINITIKPHKQNKKQLKRPTVVSREERSFRRQLHMLHLFTMVAHGVARNMWCSNKLLLSKLLAQLPNKLKSELNDYQKHRVKKDVTTQSKTRKLLDLLRHIMNHWDSLWTIDPKAPVLYKKQWNELNKQSKKLKKRNPMTEARFIRMIASHTGSRDLSALGFLAMLRALGLPARLCFSIQPPDFTNLVQISTLDSRQSTPISSSLPAQLCSITKSPPSKPKRSSTQHDRLLNALRGNRTYTNSAVKTQSEQDDDFSEKYGGWPVLWVEVWDKDSKKYITIDPAVKKLIECVSWKSKLEPPMNCIRSNTWYVVGYDRLGGVRDITRRYAREFNAKVRKKRITRDEKGQIWWDATLRGACCKSRLKKNRVDKFEEIEFEEMGLKEGMPSSVSDFKGHPIYVLEDQLKWNEVLKPKISCGTVRKKTRRGNNECDLIPVYKRSNVCSLRSAKGWYMHGRVLKIGERPLKIREKKIIKRGKRIMEEDFELSNGDDNNGDEDDRRLYAEFQTEKYVPPPVVNGRIPTNAYKNIDVYEKWMIPEGCIQVEDKNSEKAAKLMGIEYAPAVVGFDFGGDKRKQASVRLQGIVTLSEYEEAVKVVCKGLREKEEEEDIMREELVNLRAWKVLLAKLKISGRLTREHGAIEEDSEEDNEYMSEEGSEYGSENASDYVSHHEGEIEGGGFFVADPSSVGNKTAELGFERDDIDRTGLNESDFEDGNNVGTKQNNFFIQQIIPISSKKKSAEPISLFGASSGLRFGGEDEPFYDPNDEIESKNEESADKHLKKLFSNQDKFIYDPNNSKGRDQYEEMKEEGIKEIDNEYEEFENFLGDLETNDNDENENSELEGGFEKEDNNSTQVNMNELNNNKATNGQEGVIQENNVKQAKTKEIPFSFDETELDDFDVHDPEKLEKLRGNSHNEANPTISKLDENQTAFGFDANKTAKIGNDNLKDSNVLSGSHINNVISLDSDDSEPEEIEGTAKDETVSNNSDGDGYDFEYSDSE